MPFTITGVAVAVVPAISVHVTPPSVLLCHLYSIYVLKIDFTVSVIVIVLPAHTLGVREGE